MEVEGKNAANRIDGFWQMPDGWQGFFLVALHIFGSLLKPSPLVDNSQFSFPLTRDYISRMYSPSSYAVSDCRWLTTVFPRNESDLRISQESRKLPSPNESLGWKTWQRCRWTPVGEVSHLPVQSHSHVKWNWCVRSKSWSNETMDFWWIEELVKQHSMSGHGWKANFVGDYECSGPSWRFSPMWNGTYPLTASHPRGCTWFAVWCRPWCLIAERSAAAASLFPQIGHLLLGLTCIRLLQAPNSFAIVVQSLIGDVEFFRFYGPVPVRGSLLRLAQGATSL